MIKFLKLYERFGIMLFIVVGVVFLSFASPNFLKLGTILNIIAQGTFRWSRSWPWRACSWRFLSPRLASR
jgi:hypothetical protein